VQLALDPIREGAWTLDATRRALSAGGISILSGMMTTVGEDYTTLETIARTGGVRPDEHWEANLAAARENARIADEFGVRLVTLHAGFMPHGRKDPERAKLMGRLAALRDVFAGRAVFLGLETGQESAATLDELLSEPEMVGIGVNFDPANMILYGMGEPIAALERLGPRVRQVHLKDATPTTVPGTWGAEVVAGTGGVDWSRFLGLVRRLGGGRGVNVLIEREAGESREADIRAAAELARRFGVD
jgi:sugar phosphate isomerase/epimerase